jgi:hypothetical protein
MRRRLGPTLLAVVPGLGLAAPIAAANGAVDIPCATGPAHRVQVERHDHRPHRRLGSARRADERLSYQVLEQVIEGRVTHANGTLPLSFVFTHQFEYLGAVPDDPRTASASGR